MEYTYTLLFVSPRYLPSFAALCVLLLSAFDLLKTIGNDMDTIARTKEDYKPVYRDIPNTFDMKAAFDGFAYGGLYNLSVVNLDMAET